MNLQYVPFSNINLQNIFFDSLKDNYSEFSEWFGRKALEGEKAYVFYREDGEIDGFLYLKIEEGEVSDVTPPLRPARRIKVGTMKINAHGTKLGERFIKKIFDHVLFVNAEEVYVTLFEQHTSLIALYQRYGFYERARKITQNGEELVLVKSLRTLDTGILKKYPLIDLRNHNIYLLSINPQWHTRLLPDSILRTESANIVQDISHSNSIHKVYLAAMRDLPVVNPGDTILIYRTTDNMGPAHYRSVVTSICVVEEYRDIHSFNSCEEFMAYCRPYSVFTDEELENLWRTKRFPHVIRFTYNIALNRRVTRGQMIEHIGLDQDAYW